VTDYSRLIDAQIWAFIERTNSYYPPDAVGLSIEGQREVYDRMCAAFRMERPADVRCEDMAITAAAHPVPVRIYESRGRPVTVVYFHGGGYVVGGLDSHDDVCAEICSRTGYRVVSVDYRLSPEHAHPAAFDDAVRGCEWASCTYRDPVVLAGDSAGGNLAAAVSHATRNWPDRPIGQVLIYPGLGGDRSKGSYREHAEAPMLTLADIDYYSGIRTGGVERRGDPTLAPLADTDFSGLPPTVAIAAQCDPLADDCEAYCRKVRQAGGKAHWVVEPGLVHGYLRARHSVDRARESFTRIVNAVAALGKGEWPY
jgi:acetyl esterase